MTEATPYILPYVRINNSDYFRDDRRGIYVDQHMKPRAGVARIEEVHADPSLLIETRPTVPDPRPIAMLRRAHALAREEKHAAESHCTLLRRAEVPDPFKLETATQQLALARHKEQEMLKMLSDAIRQRDLAKHLAEKHLAVAREMSPSR